MHLSSIYELNFLYSLALTILLEAFTLSVLLFYFYKKTLSVKEMLMVYVLPSFASLPYVWFLFPAFLQENYTLYLVVAECFVLIVEMLLLSYLLKFSLKDGFILSLSANLVSAVVGSWIADII